MAKAKKFNVKTFNVTAFDSILSHGLSNGLGKRGKQVCIEAAICQVLNLPHGDDPGCVAESVRLFKISLNDAKWSSPQARASGLRDLGIAQLGSKGIVDDIAFSVKLIEKTIRVLIPKLFRQVFPDNQKCLETATRCEIEGTSEASRAATWAASEASRAASEASRAASEAFEASEASWAASEAFEASEASRAASWAVTASAVSNEYLILSASLALETLRELKSPGIALLKEKM